MIWIESYSKYCSICFSLVNIQVLYKFEMDSSDSENDTFSKPNEFEVEQILKKRKRKGKVGTISIF